MTVAAAGRHHIMAWGSPGCGKSMALQHLPEITPLLLPEERLPVERIYSLAGMDIKPDAFRPFRVPHQTASIEGICGGGPNCRPGEITLAHNGTLFLDEAAEFRTSVLQMLRCPLESGTITLCRAGRSTTFPANFQLAMAVEPCPCGNYGSHDKICLCSAKSIDQYWKKFSAPLLDRINIRFNCNEVIEDFTDFTVEEARKRIKLAWERQYKRCGRMNQYLSPQEIAETIVISPEAQKRLDKEIERCGLSPRAISNIIKVAQTIKDIDLEERNLISEKDIDLACKLHAATPLSE
jgi:magnesium chelatase family protein